MRPLHIALAALAFTAAPPALADSRLVFHDSGDDSESILLVRDGIVRMEEHLAAGDNDSFVLFDSSRRIMTIIDHGERSYHVMTEEAIGDQMAVMEEAMQEMAEELARQLESMPPDERRMMESQMAAMGMDPHAPGLSRSTGDETAAPTFRATGRGEMVAGVSCEIVEALLDGVITEEICLAGSDAIAIPSADHEAVATLMDFMARVSATMGSPFGVNPGPDSGLPIGGIPISIRAVDEESHLRLREFSSQGLDAGLFQIPAGYEAVDPL